MTNWLVTREDVKRAARRSGATAIGDDRNRVIDLQCEASSRAVENAVRRLYIPRTDTKRYRWPSYSRGFTWSLDLGQDLLACTTLQAAAGGQGAVPVALTHYFLEPQQFGPPYARIEIDLASSDVFSAGSTPQEAIAVTGRWGFSEATQPAGAVAGAALATVATATSFACSDASLIDVGDTLLIGTEQLFVSERAPVDTAATVQGGGITAAKSVVSLTVSDGTKVKQGEVLLIDSEQFYASSVTGNVVSIERDWNGTQLAAHAADAKVYAYRTLTVERGVNGTTAVVHADTTAITRYVPYGEAARMALADCISVLAQQDAAFGRMVGPGGQGGMVYSGTGVSALWERFKASNSRMRTATP